MNGVFLTYFSTLYDFARPSWDFCHVEWAARLLLVLACRSQQADCVKMHLKAGCYSPQEGTVARPI